MEVQQLGQKPPKTSAAPMGLRAFPPKDVDGLVSPNTIVPMTHRTPGLYLRGVPREPVQWYNTHSASVCTTGSMVCLKLTSQASNTVLRVHL
jgi:hypothetical protein